MSVEQDFLDAFTRLKLRLAEVQDTEGMAVLDKLLQDNIMLHTKLGEVLDEQEKARING